MSAVAGVAAAAVCDYDWHVSRQRTEREAIPLDRHGAPQYWTGYLAQGTAGTFAHARSAALKELKRLRAAHIGSAETGGGDVGYGDAPTGEQIRAYLASREASKKKSADKVDSGQPAG